MIARSRRNILYSVLVVLILLLAGFMFFYGLGEPSVRMWDESRLAVNAVEMLDNGQRFVTYYNGEPDMWNTKPPLMIWLIALGMSVLGADTLALRLPSALSGLTTAAIILGFCSYYLKTLQVGLLSTLVLITSVGYVGEHVTRTGDYDALLVLWITIYSLSLFIHFNQLTQKPSRSTHLWVAGIAFVLAIWTKGIAGAIVLPGILLYLTTQPRVIKKIIFNPHSYYVILFCISFALFPYIIRELQNPGYIQAVIGNEISGRYSEAIEKHAAPVTFYLEGLLSKYIPWIYLWIPSSILALLSKQDLVKAYGRFSLFYLASFIAIISFAHTKLPWYDAPIYPIASISVGLGIYQIHGILQLFWKGQNYLRIPFVHDIKLPFISLTMALMLGIPILHTGYHHIYKNHGMLYPWSHVNEPTLQYGDYFKQLSVVFPEMKEFIVPVKLEDYNAHLQFYATAYRRQGFHIRLEPYNLKRNVQETLVTCDPALRDEMLQSISLKQLHQSDFCTTMLVQ